MDRKILEWIFTENPGLSSMAIAAKMAGIDCGEVSHPYDPADLRRCIEFLDFVPGTRERLSEMCEVSPQWFRLVTAWEALELKLKEEMSRDDRYAPETYEMMQAILRN